MSSLFTILLIPAITAIVFPVYTFLTKESVSKTNMTLFGTQLIIGLTFFFYACRFHDFFVSEYLLNFAFSSLSLFAAPLFHVFVCSLTQPEGLTKKNRHILIVPIITAAILSLLTIVCSIDDCRHYAIQVLYHRDFSLIPGNFTYNTLLIIAFYAFYAIFAIETITIVIMSIKKIDKYIKFLKEFYSTNEQDIARNKFLLLNCILVLVTFITIMIVKLFFAETSGLFLAISLATTLSQLHFSWYGHTHTMSAEQITAKLNDSDTQYPSIRPKPIDTKNTKDSAYNSNQITFEEEDEIYHNKISNDQQINEMLTDFIENKQLFLNPDISIELLSELMKINQRDLVDIINKYKGYSFSEYIDELRINKATQSIYEMIEQSGKEKVIEYTKDRNFLDKLAQDVGYTNGTSFQTGFEQVMNVSLSNWLAEIF